MRVDVTLQLCRTGGDLPSPSMRLVLIMSQNRDNNLHRDREPVHNNGTPYPHHKYIRGCYIQILLLVDRSFGCE